jgi:predicted aspartyl protease
MPRRLPHLLFACAAACAAPSNVVGAPAPHAAVVFDPACSSALTVERAPTGHLLVHPWIDGKPAGTWIFDTGAGMCVVSTPRVAELALRAGGRIDAVGIGGAESAATYTAPTLTLGPMTLRDHALLATDLSFLERHLGQPITGVVGYGVLSHCVAELDFVAARIDLHDPATYELAAAQWTELDLAGRTPAVHATFEGHEGLFQIDTGQNSAVVCQWATVAELGLHERDGLREASVRGVGGQIAAKAGTLAWFEFGGVRQENVDALFLLEAKGSRADTRRAGAIGAALLRPFVLITDYRNARIAFRPRG